MPAVGVEALRHLFGESKVGVAFDRDVVIVVQVDQLTETEMTGEGRSLRRDALHQVAIADEPVHVMVDDVVPRTVEVACKELLCYRHSDSVREALAQRPSGSLYARRSAVFWVSRRLAIP